MTKKTETERLAEALASLAATITEVIDSKVRELAQTGSAKEAPETGDIKTLNPAEGWASFQETAEHLKISRRTLYDWMKRGTTSTDKKELWAGLFLQRIS